MNNNIYKRLAQVEAMVALTRAELNETIRTAYEAACKQENEEDAAALARKLRNKMLDDSDAQMSFDRLSLDLSSATKFIASLKEIFNGDWAKYRQALRDLPEQEGFPFNIEFPHAPNVEETEDQYREIIKK